MENHTNKWKIVLFSPEFINKRQKRREKAKGSFVLSRYSYYHRFTQTDTPAPGISFPPIRYSGLPGTGKLYVLSA